MGINANVSYFTSGQIIGLQYDAQTDIINFRSADGMLVQWKVGLTTFGSWTNVGTSAPNNLITDGLGDVSAARGATLEIANGTGGSVKVVDGSGAVLKDFTGQQQWGSYFKNGVFDTDGKHLFLWDAYQSKIVVFETSTWQQVGEVDGWTGSAMTGAGAISPMQIISGGKGLMIGIDRGAQIFDLTETLKLTKTGGGSADVLDGAIGTDTLSGAGGADTLSGAGGNDSLSGGDGDDRIVGGAGADTMSGGAGADTFVFAKGDSSPLAADRITDWNSSDKLVFANGAVSAGAYVEGASSDYASALSVANSMIASGSTDALAIQIGSDMVVFVDSGNDNGQADDIVVLVGRTAADISVANFGGAAPPPAYNVITGTAGVDILNGTALNDSISAGAGADIINWSAGTDVVDGGDGSDTLAFDTASFAVSVDVSFATAQAVGSGSVTLISVENLIGGSGDDVLKGDGQANTLIGGLGADTLGGGAGNDLLNGQDGNDSLVGHDGADTLIGGAGADTLVGGAGADNLEGGAGADTFIVATGESQFAARDRITSWEAGDRLTFSGVGANPLYIEATKTNASEAQTYARDLIAAGTADVVSVAVGGDVLVFADNGTDNNGAAEDVVTLVGRTLADVAAANFGATDAPSTPTYTLFTGGSGEDIFQGTAGPDSISAGGGIDTIFWSGGGDVVDGGAGNDWLFFDQPATPLTIDLSITTAQQTGLGMITLISVENVGGGLNDDVLKGDAAANVFSGFAGNDTLTGRGGDDVLDGGAGNDLLEGGDGSDTLYGGFDSDTIVGGAGFDQLEGGWYGDTFVFATGDSAPGNPDVIMDWEAADRIVFSGLGANPLYAEAEKSSVAEAQSYANGLIASGAADVVAVGVGADVLVFADSGNNNGVADDVVKLASASIWNLDPWHFGATNAPPPPVGISGTSGNDNLTGTANADTINGLAGNDTLNGGNGNDSLVGGLGVDVLTGGAGADVFTAGATALGGSKAGTDKITDFTSADFVVMGGGAGALNTYTEIFSLNYNDAYAHAQALFAAGVDYTAIQVFTDVYVFALRTNEVIFLENASTEDISAANFGATYVAPNFSGESSPWTFGTSGADTMATTLDHIQIQSGAGDDHLSNPTVWMSDLWGGDGNDTAIGSGMYDNIRGENGADSLNGMGGGDMMTGGAGNDYMLGGAGTDIVWGQDGNDTVDGGDDMDEVRGGAGDDVLTGGTGEDWMAGDQGSDTLTGGQGPDVFYASNYMGLDRVTDFSLADGDRVVMDPGTAYSVSQVGADTVISIGSGNQMVLVGVQASSLLSTSIFQTWEWTI